MRANNSKDKDKEKDKNEEEDDEEYVHIESGGEHRKSLLGGTKFAEPNDYEVEDHSSPIQISSDASPITYQTVSRINRSLKKSTSTSKEEDLSPSNTHELQPLIGTTMTSHSPLRSSTTEESESNLQHPPNYHESLLSRSTRAHNYIKPINFATGMLIQTWCRHQYVKGLLPTLMYIWYFSFLFLAIQYEKDSAAFLREEATNYNCTVINRESLPFYPINCEGINRANQYYQLDNHGISIKLTLDCTLPGADFYFDKEYWGLTPDNSFVQIILNYIAPLVFTYFIYETCYLALYDCLVIVPGVDETTQRPILRYADGPFRVSWFIVRDLYYRCSRQHRGGENSNTMMIFEGERKGKILPSEAGLVPKKWPGIRTGYMASLCANWFFVLTWTTISSFAATSDNVYRCTEESQTLINKATEIVIVILIILVLVVSLPGVVYYYRLFFQIRDIEILATSYSEEFTLRRHAGIRNILDLLPALVFPLVPNVVYYSVWIFPHCIVYLLVKGILFLLAGCCISAVEHAERAVDSYYRAYVWNLDDRWWCAWFVQAVHESEMKSKEPLLMDS